MMTMTTMEWIVSRHKSWGGESSLVDATVDFDVDLNAFLSIEERYIHYHPEKNSILKSLWILTQ